MDLTDAKKLEMIAYVVDLQTRAQNDEDGDQYQADAFLAMEAIEQILSGDPDFRRNGAVRTFLGDSETNPQARMPLARPGSQEA